MAATLESHRTIHLTPDAAPPAPTPPATRKSLRLTDLRPGQTARILKVSLGDAACRKRFAEMGLAEGMKITVTGGGKGADTLMLLVGSTRMGLAARCADHITVLPLSA